MSTPDFIKATVVCGGVAYLLYRFPVISQILLIGSVALIWATYLYKTLTRRQAG